MIYGLDAYYKLMNNINADVDGYDTGAGFVPVGNGDYNFTGQFDGTGHTITGLTINRPYESYVGLFGYTFNETIQNVGLVNINITGSDYVGGIVGGNYNAPGTIKTSYATGTVTGENYVGGLIGYNRNSAIRNCYAKVAITGYDDVGGLVGTNDGDSIIENSYSTGIVVGGRYRWTCGQ
jgi:hypothetical protein